MDFVTFLPGVRRRAATVSRRSTACRSGAINITLDGVNIQDNTLQSTDGFFAIVSPRLDAVEEVTVTTAGQGAERRPGRGADQVRDALGHEQFSGSGYHYYRSDKLNANTWFNNRERRGEDAAETEPVRRAGRRADRDSRALRRPEQGVLLRQLRGVQPAGRRDAQPQHAEHGAQQGIFSYTTPVATAR